MKFCDKVPNNLPAIIANRFVRCNANKIDLRHFIMLIDSQVAFSEI